MRATFLLFSAIIGFGFNLSTGKRTGMVHVEGIYSKNGAAALACYGSNMGYITTDQGKRIPLCFDRQPNASSLTIECEGIAVDGHYEEKKIEASGNCKAGSMNILYVDRWSCE